MYLQRFGLRSLPFRLSPDSAFVFPSSSHAAALDTLRSMLLGPGGITLVTGPAGVGKTTLIDRMLLDIPPSTAVARLNQGLPTAIALLQGLLMQFGYAPFHLTRAELGSALHTFLAERERMGEPTLVIVDEAQRLDGQALIELLQATNPYSSRLHLVLVGNGELAERMDGAAMTPIQTAIRTRITLTPLRPDEVPRYLQHRLDTAGASGKPVFDAAAVDMLTRVTAGLPKFLNKLADGAMTAAYEDVRDQVRSDDVLAASRLLGTIENSQRRPLPATSSARTVAPAPSEPPAVPPPAPPAPGRAEAPPLADSSGTDLPNMASGSVPVSAEKPTLAMTAESDPEAETAAEPTGNEEGAGTHWTITAEEESAGPPAPIYRVHLHHDGARLETIQLLPGELTIGRTRDNDLQIESRYISRRHCRLLLTASGLSVEDLGSTNGTFVNAVQARRQPVNSGDIVRIGMHELSVEVFVPQD